MSKVFGLRKPLNSRQISSPSQLQHKQDYECELKDPLLVGDSERPISTVSDHVDEGISSNAYSEGQNSETNSRRALFQHNRGMKIAKRKIAKNTNKELTPSSPYLLDTERSTAPALKEVFSAPDYFHWDHFRFQLFWWCFLPFFPLYWALRHCYHYHKGGQKGQEDKRRTEDRATEEQGTQLRVHPIVFFLWAAAFAIPLVNAIKTPERAQLTSVSVWCPAAMYFSVGLLRACYTTGQHNIQVNPLLAARNTTSDLTCFTDVAP
jgi:hypothetical protein